MPSKIFISYRREDAAAAALGISQYLENQFGRKNVFIDVDMRAGAKFPTVLAERLAECKVMLALIGPGWLIARDEQGRRRLDLSDDWVRLEIAHALKRNIAVIPVRVNGADLPSKEALPEEIKGLLDHQAVTVSTTGFRHEMVSLARDIRAIPDTRSWWRVTALAACALLIIAVAVGLTQKFGLLGRGRNAETPPSANQDAIWTSKPGEWVMFAVDKNPIAYYYNPSYVKVFGTNVAYTARIPIKLTNPASGPSEQTAAYDDDELVIDCKRSLWAEAQITFYNKAGEVISHFHRADPETMDLSSSGQPIPAGSILSLAQHLLCDEQLRRPLLTKQQLSNNAKMSYLTPTPDGAGDIFFGPPETDQDGKHFETVTVIKFHENRGIAALFPGQSVLGLPSSFRTEVDRVQGDCIKRKYQNNKTEYFDLQNNLVSVTAPIELKWIDINESAPFGRLFDVACGPPINSVAGTYEGTNNASYGNGGQGEQRITITVEQSGSDVTVAFKTPNGGEGKGSGKLTGTAVNSLVLQSTARDCPGSYEGSLTFVGDTVNWSFEGKDCGGPMKGHGEAKRKV
ncbi:MAG: toll/interleukin-1 receptor domain-containing protein [Xanthobacteraceae bacterium]